jgi:hypothetical protein
MNSFTWIETYNERIEPLMDADKHGCSGGWNEERPHPTG